MNELSIQKKQQEVIHQQKHEETAQHMMKPLEKWDVRDGEDLATVKTQYIEQAIVLQQHYNEVLLRQMEQQIPQQQVNQAAPVEHPPVQQQAAQETYKERRERRKKIRKAQKICPVGDEFTLDIAKQIKKMDAGKDHALSLYLDSARAEQVHADKRMLKVFCQGFQTARNGTPLPAYAQHAQMDQAFITDYLSGDLERRRPHLERITQEMLSMRLTPDTFSLENLTKHPERLKDMGDKMVYFENLQKENPAFFENLPQVQKDMLAALQPVYVAYSGAFAMHMQARGINYNKGAIYGADAMSAIQMGQASQEPMEQLYQESLRQFAQASKDVLEQEAERRTKHYEEDGQAANDEMVQAIREEAGDMNDIEFTSNVTFYQYEDLNKYRKMMADHPAQYQANKPLLDAIYQEYYRMLDVSGSIVYKMRAMQSCIDDIPFHASYLDRAIKKTISDKQEALLAQKDILDGRSLSLADLMEHFLRGKPMSPAAAATVEEFRQRVAPPLTGNNPDPTE